jgi:hypothetical protein
VRTTVKGSRGESQATGEDIHGVYSSEFEDVASRRQRTGEYIK